MLKKVSVIIPTYKGSKCIKNAIDSVLGQDYSFYEIVIVDDNEPSSAERRRTEEVVNQYLFDSRIKYVKHKCNQNGAVARNTGVSASDGFYLAFLDDDDIYCASRLKKMVNAIEYQGADIAFSDVVVKNKDKLARYIKCGLSNDNFLATFLNENIIGTGSNILLKAALYKSINGFDEALIRNQDIDFLLNIFSHNIVATWIKEPLVIKNESSTGNIPSYQEMVKIKKYLYDKYEAVINSYSEDTRKKILISIHRSLLKTAIQKQNVEGINYEKKYLGNQITPVLKLESMLYKYPHINAMAKAIYHSIKLAMKNN